METEQQLVMLQNEGWGSTVCEAMDGFRQNGEFCNVTLLSNDSRSFVAHDCVLAAASSYLKSLLTNMDLPSCMLKLETIPGDVIEYILQFMYSGSVCLPLSKLATIATASEQLGVDQLKTLCDGFLKDFDIDGGELCEENAEQVEQASDVAEGVDLADVAAESNDECVIEDENETEELVTVKYEPSKETDCVDATCDESMAHDEVAEDEKDSKDCVAAVRDVIPSIPLEIAATTIDAETVVQTMLELPPEARQILDGDDVVAQPSEDADGNVGQDAAEQVIYVQSVSELDLDGLDKTEVMENVAILQPLEGGGNSRFIMTGVYQFVITCPQQLYVRDVNVCVCACQRSMCRCVSK